jgi:hypothetical protein
VVSSSCFLLFTAIYAAFRQKFHLSRLFRFPEPALTTALWGARHPCQLQPIDEVFGWSLDASVKDEIEQILGESINDPVGPEFMAPPART